MEPLAHSFAAVAILGSVAAAGVSAAAGPVRAFVLGASTKWRFLQPAHQVKSQRTSDINRLTSAIASMSSTQYAVVTGPIVSSGAVSSHPPRRCAFSHTFTTLTPWRPLHGAGRWCVSSSRPVPSWRQGFPPRFVCSLRHCFLPRAPAPRAQARRPLSTMSCPAGLAWSTPASPLLPRWTRSPRTR